MEQPGYLYVLANSAMPGLVKVGKTTRSSSERAIELSAATGLPTPFIVVYEQLFLDCGVAESFVHTHLERNGYRVADNREFFNAPVNVVVKAIALAPGAIENDSLEESPVEADDFLPAREVDELDALSLTTSEPTYPWLSVLDEAEMHYYGIGDCIQDFTEAMRLFSQAARLGSLSAYGYIGNMYADGEGIRQDPSKALEVYKEGARKGSAYCYWKMGMLFTHEGNHVNAEKCFSLFVKNMPAKLPDSQCLTDIQLSSVLVECVRLIGDKVKLPLVLNGFVVEHAADILQKATKFLELSRSRGDAMYESMMEKRRLAVVEYLNGIAHSDFDKLRAIQGGA